MRSFRIRRVMGSERGRLSGRLTVSAMKQTHRIPLIVLAALAVLLGGASVLLSRIDIRSRVEAAGNQATGLTVVVAGDASLRLLPAPHLSLQDVTIRTGDAEFGSVGSANIRVAAWPLLTGNVRVTAIQLKDVSVTIERRQDGTFNFSRPASGSGVKLAARTGNVSVTNLAFRYLNQQSEREIVARGCDLDTDDARIAGGAGSDLLQQLSLTARFSCAELQNSHLHATLVRGSVAGERGVFKLEPLTLRLLGGEGEGDVEADFTADLPSYRIRYSIHRLQVDDLFRSLTSGRKGTGFMDFTTELHMSGFDAEELQSTAAGTASLHGEALEVAVGDLDEKLSRYASSQSFNLIDVGAFFIAGPLGTAVTKGYDFANLFQDPGGTTRIVKLVSHWSVQDGVAQAGDVALVTPANRLALQGRLDFVNRQFDGVKVAVVDDEGCAKIEQRISGSFNQPDIVKPNIIASLVGPVSSTLARAGRVLGMDCEVFYSGSLPPLN